MAHRRRPNQGSEVPFGEWIPAHAVRFNSDGTVSLMAEVPTKNPSDDPRDAMRRFLEPPGKMHLRLIFVGLNRWKGLAGSYRHLSAES